MHIVDGGASGAAAKAAAKAAAEAAAKAAAEAAAKEAAKDAAKDAGKGIVGQIVKDIGEIAGGKKASKLDLGKIFDKVEKKILEGGKDLGGKLKDILGGKDKIKYDPHKCCRCPHGMHPLPPGGVTKMFPEGGHQHPPINPGPAQTLRHPEGGMQPPPVVTYMMGEGGVQLPPIMTRMVGEGGVQFPPVGINPNAPTPPAVVQTMMNPEGAHTVKPNAAPGDDE